MGIAALLAAGIVGLRSLTSILGGNFYTNSSIYF